MQFGAFQEPKEIFLDIKSIPFHSPILFGTFARKSYKNRPDNSCGKMEKAITFRIRLFKFSVLINLDLMNHNFDN